MSYETGQIRDLFASENARPTTVKDSLFTGVQGTGNTTQSAIFSDSSGVPEMVKITKKDVKVKKTDIVKGMSIVSLPPCPGLRKQIRGYSEESEESP
jgi:hypothetical protein